MPLLYLNQAIPRFKENEERIDIFINGDETTTYLTSGDVEVPSIQKFLFDKNVEINNNVDSILVDVNASKELAQAASLQAEAYAYTATVKATEATTSATSADTDAAAALASQIAAANSANNAATSAAAALASQTSATASASSATTSAATATTKASEASTSATNAANSASAAATSESNADASADAAAASAAAAATFDPSSYYTKTAADARYGQLSAAVTFSTITQTNSVGMARNVDTGNLTLFGGTSGNGANIELYGSTHATQANNAFYDATVHTFRNAGGAGTPPVKIGAYDVYHSGNFSSITVGDNFIINGAGNTVLYYRENGTNRASAHYDIGGDHYAINMYNSGGSFVRSFVLGETGGITWGGNAIWHAGNDGAGSGSDADLLDGQQGSYYTDIVARLGYTPLNAAGGTITGDLNIGTQPGQGVTLHNSGALEIIRVAGPFIDFKNSSADDFDVRLIQSGINHLDMQTAGGTGILSVDGSAVIRTNTLAASMNGIAYNAIGAIAMMRKTVAGTVDQGATIAGSSLVYSNADGSYTSSAASGTWECLGRASGSTGAAATAAWRKIA